MDRPASRDLARLVEYGQAFERPAIWSWASAVDGLRAAVDDLVPGDIAVITVSTRDPWTATVYATDEALGARRNGAVELWGQCLDRRENPVVSYHTETGQRRAAMLSDFMSPLRFRRTSLYDYFLRPFAIDRTMGARIDTSAGDVYLASYRSRLDFSERDRWMLNGLSAHARRLLYRCEVAELAAACRVDFGLTAREAEILALAIRGRSVSAIASLLVLSPPTVKAHLHNVYSKTGWRSRAAAAAEVYGATRRHEDAMGGAGAQLGLTSRETDVVLALARGRTNREIATALGVSLETAKTHLRHAYRKLGVGNRAGAVARFLEPGRTPA
jgi:DNA-binding CsgD family transcriptional regulator